MDRRVHPAPANRAERKTACRSPDRFRVGAEAPFVGLRPRSRGSSGQTGGTAISLRSGYPPDMQKKPTEVEAWALLRDFARETESTLGDRMECLTVFGSLVNGDYVPGFSDIDQVVVVRSGNGWRDSAELVQHIVRRFNRGKRYPGLRLHEGYVVARNRIWSRDLDREDGLVPRDVRDLILHGRTLAGRAIWPEVQGPSDDELREAAIYFVYWIPTNPPGFKALLNCVFAVAGARYRLATGRSTWTKNELVRAYGEARLPGSDLVEEAGRLRSRGCPPGPSSKAAFDRLLPRYAELLSETRAWLTSSGQNRLRILRTRTVGVSCGPEPRSIARAATTRTTDRGGRGSSSERGCSNGLEPKGVRPRGTSGRLRGVASRRR